ncbi:MAG: transposase [Thermoanaerobaculia bacterium]|nr:transposase [Thermoanaerobaculia bacterium]
MATRRRRFTAELEREAVQMVLSGQHGLAEVARDLDLRPDMLRRWRHRFLEDPQQAFPGNGRMKPDDEELRQLRREVRRLREERAILKKALAIFSEIPR